MAVNRKTIYAALAFLGLLLFVIAHQDATVARGYEALGGEFFFLGLPFFAYLAELCWRA